MKICLRKFLKRGEGPSDLNQVKELNTKPFGAPGACIKQRPALTSRLVSRTPLKEGGTVRGGMSEEGLRPVGPLDRWVTSLGDKSGLLGQAGAGGKMKVEEG